MLPDELLEAVFLPHGHERRAKTLGGRAVCIVAPA